ncbi:MAG: M23 family peptidase, partial [Candidatus Zixiibacteriota bacterium]
MALFLIGLLPGFIPGRAAAGELVWPLKYRIDLSNGFGEFREGRFHAGLDLRTGGRTGRRVVSPVDGYVWRVKMAYDGYGKGLYVKGDDGYVYVLAHLSRFVPAIERPVKLAQLAARRY